MRAPDDAILGRFRAQLVKHDLWEQLLGEINRQLEVQNIIMRMGRINMIDTTPVEVAQSGSGTDKDGMSKRDKDAEFHVKNTQEGSKTGNVHDLKMTDVLLLGDESALYTDAAYTSQKAREKLKVFGIKDRIQRKGYRGKPLGEQDRQRNKVIAVPRSGSERPFATYKQHYGLVRT